MNGMTSFDQLPVGSVAADQVVRISPDAALRVVAAAMHDNDVGALIVGKKGVDGIITERDLVRAIAQDLDPATTKAIDIATTHPVWCDTTATVAEAAQTMADHWVRHLLLERNGRLVGIVSARDLLGMCTPGVDNMP